jgi:predicted  nucleic acid-binding Zn-ribbon protein
VLGAAASEHALLRIGRGALLAALAAATLIAAGCGDDDPEEVRDEYVREVQDAIRPVAEQSQELFTQVGEARSLEDLSPPLGRTQRAYQDAADALESIDPPDEAANLHAQFIDTHQQVAEAAEAAAESAKKRQGEELKEYEEAGDRYARRSEEITRKLSERGFDF